MAFTGPIVLVGDNLGQRQRYLNNLVNDAFRKGVTFESVIYLPDKTPVDRIFKIDLASKYYNLDYILQCLKDENMLYVSRALKCSWLLLEPYSNIINPEYLETKLFPEMLTTASNKMKHWISLNLKDRNRCKLFYEHYKITDIDFALKFLPKTPKDYLLNEIEEIPSNKITPHFLKLLCEQSPKCVDTLFHRILEHGDENHLRSIQMLLKTDPELYFKIIESSYYHTFKRLNDKATKYIMKNHKQKYLEKSELYAGWILHLPTLAKFLDENECKAIIIKLTKAPYLKNNFSYKVLEPLVKKINPQERKTFCTKVFEENSFISVPLSYPIRQHQPDNLSNVTIEPDYTVGKGYDGLLDGPPKLLCMIGGGGIMKPIPSRLDQLFNQYRFSSFEATLTSLKKKIGIEGSPAGRKNMMLVLVSKSGGRINSLRDLLEFLVTKHLNEPANLRAAIVRSLVKRAAVWRLPPDVWELFLTFAYGLGLDGCNTEVSCEEGLRAVILHNLINNLPLPREITERFFEGYSCFTDYSLTVREKDKVEEYLTSELLSKAKIFSPESAQNILVDLVEVIHEFKSRVTDYPEVIQYIREFARDHFENAKPVLRKLFKTYEARKEFFIMNFIIIQTDASYLNALRHDAEIILEFDELRNFLTYDDLKDFNRSNFFRKLAVYFSEDGGLAEDYADLLECKGLIHPKLTKPYKMLTGKSLKEKLRSTFFEDSDEPIPKKPRLDAAFECQLGKWDLESVANWIQRASIVELRNNIVTLLTQPRWAFLVMALRAAKWPGLLAGTLPAALCVRPTRAVRVALRILRQNPETSLSQDWLALKSVIRNLQLKTQNANFYHDLARINHIPNHLKLEFCLVLYRFLIKHDLGSSRGPSYQYALPVVLYLKKHCFRLSDDCIVNILRHFLDKDFTLLKFKENYYHGRTTNGYVIVRYRSYSLYTDGALKEWYYHYYVGFILKILANFLMTRSDSTDSEIVHLFLDKVKEFWCAPIFHAKCSLISNLHRNVIKCPTIFDEFLTSFYDLQFLLKNVKFLDRAIEALNLIRELCEGLYPLHKNFKGNYTMKLCLLYACAINSVYEQNPSFFSFQNERDVVRAVSLDFGLKVADDVENVVSENFHSIWKFYAGTLYRYLGQSGLCQSAVIKGLFQDTSKINAMYVGLYLQMNCRLEMNTEMRSLLSRIQELNFFVCAQLEARIFNEDKLFPQL